MSSLLTRSDPPPITSRTTTSTTCAPATGRAELLKEQLRQPNRPKSEAEPPRDVAAVRAPLRRGGMSSPGRRRCSRQGTEEHRALETASSQCRSGDLDK